MTNFNESIHGMKTQLQEYKNQMAAELAQLQTSLNTTQSLDTKLQALESSLHTKFQALESSLDTKLMSLAASLLQHDSKTLAQDQLQMTTQNLQNNLTHQLNDVFEQSTECVFMWRHEGLALCCVPRYFTVLGEKEVCLQHMHEAIRVARGHGVPIAVPVS